MTRARRWPAVLLLAACTATEPAPPTTPTAGTAADASARRGFADVMHRVDAQVQRLDRLLLAAAPVELVDAAHAADATAELLRLGYGTFERADVAGFARLAHDAESWLLQVALEARQGHGQLAAELFRAGREQHCQRCHDAVDRAAR